MERVTSESPSTSKSVDEEQSLILNISQYKSHLDEVNGAIKSASEEDRIKLQELQLNLINVLELMLSQLDQLQSSNSSGGSNGDQIASESTENNVQKSNSDIEDEFKKFKMEIEQLEGKTETKDPELHEQEEEKQESHFAEKMKDFETSLKALEGQEVRVPFTERWGGYSYHNAVVMNLVAEEGQVIDYDNPQVSVLFSQPTSLAMLPCKYFLDGKCKFDSTNCRFSHGEVVAVEDIREYNEPDREKIVAGSNVLALHEGQDIWHRGKVEDVLEGRTGFSFSCSPCGSVFEVSLSSMFPVYADEETSDNEGQEYVQETVAQPEDEASNAGSEANLGTDTLGEWEKHTRGIGSKLMAKMGYVTGTGLGPRGEGRVDPVLVQVYPQGVSLDHCMHLKELSNGEGPLEDLQRQLLKQQKKEDEKRRKQSKNALGKTSVFGFLNDKLGSPSGIPLRKENQRLMHSGKNDLKKDSTKELNRKNYQLSSSIDKIKEEMKTLNRSRDRQSKDLETTKAIDKKMNRKSEELSQLQKAFKQVETEQENRKNMQKYCSF